MNTLGIKRGDTFNETAQNKTISIFICIPYYVSTVHGRKKENNENVEGVIKVYLENERFDLS